MTSWGKGAFRLGLVAALAGAVALGVLAWGIDEAVPPPSVDTVVLLHGLGRTELSMALLAERIEAAGYRVINVGYPSREETVETLTARLRRELVACCADRLDELHFVTHSMGGILVRAYLAEHSPRHRGRVVMLAPPNQGSEVVDALAEWPFAGALLGPSGSLLGTDSMALPVRLGPATFELGVVAGSRSLNPVGSSLIPGSDDGKVAVSAAWLEGAADSLVVPGTHTFLMNRRDVAEAVLRFLDSGSFEGGPVAADGRGTSR